MKTFSQFLEDAGSGKSNEYRIAKNLRKKIPGSTWKLAYMLNKELPPN